MVDKSIIAIGHRYDGRKPQDTKIPAFVPPRPRDRRRLGKGDSRAGYWCRRTAYLAKKVAVASREAREAKKLVRVAHESHEQQLQQLREQMQTMQKLLAARDRRTAFLVKEAREAKEEAREAKEATLMVRGQLKEMQELKEKEMQEQLRLRAARRLQAAIRGNQGRRAAQDGSRMWQMQVQVEQRWAVQILRSIIAPGRWQAVVRGCRARVQANLEAKAAKHSAVYAQVHLAACRLHEVLCWWECPTWYATDVIDIRRLRVNNIIMGECTVGDVIRDFNTLYSIYDELAAISCQ